MKTIKNPALRMIQSPPSSLGTLDYYIVIYDLAEFPLPDSTIWFEENEAEIADSVRSYHYLSTKNLGQNIQIRTGFHEVMASENMPQLSFDWDLMSNIDNDYQELEVNKEAFFNAYKTIIETWKKSIPTLSAS